MTDTGLTVADGHAHGLAIVNRQLARALAPDAGPAFPSHAALLNQAAEITEAAREAKVLAEDEGWRALARARQRRSGDVIDRARNRQGAFARLR